MNSENQEQRNARIVILGGGFGGAYTAQKLEKKAKKWGAEVVLIDRRNYILFTPLMVEAGTGRLEPRHAVVPTRSFVKDTTFVMADVVDVDVPAQEVVYKVEGTDRVRRLEYDHLVLSLGSVTMMPPVKGLKEYGFELKSIVDCVSLRDRAIQMLEIANTIEDEEERRELLHFVFVGASYTGVEAAGEFQAFLTSASRSYSNVNVKDIQITLVEMKDRILPTLDEGLAEYALNDLRRRRVVIRFNCKITEIEETRATLSTDDVLRTRTVVWCAGIAPNPLLKRLPFETDERGYLLCERDLRLKGYDNVWAIGDCAVNRDENGNPYPATAQHATQMATHLAKNLTAALEGHPTTPCNARSRGVLAAFGCYSAVAMIGGLRLSGFPAWWMWRTVYLMKMPSWRRRIRIALDWTADLFLRRDIVQLGVHRVGGRPKPEPVPSDLPSTVPGEPSPARSH